jgi:hypothetical protein
MVDYRFPNAIRILTVAPHLRDQAGYPFPQSSGFSGFFGTKVLTKVGELKNLNRHDTPTCFMILN